MATQDSDDRRVFEIAGPLFDLANSAAATLDWEEYLNHRKQFYSLRTTLNYLKEVYRERWKAEPPGAVLPDFPIFAHDIPEELLPRPPVEPEEPSELVGPVEPVEPAELRVSFGLRLTDPPRADATDWMSRWALGPARWYRIDYAPWFKDVPAKGELYITTRVHGARHEGYGPFPLEFEDGKYYYFNLTTKVLSEIGPVAVKVPLAFTPHIEEVAYVEENGVAAELVSLPEEDPRAAALLAEIERLADEARSIRDRAAAEPSYETYGQLKAQYIQLRYTEIPPIVAEYRQEFDPLFSTPDLGTFPDYKGADRPVEQEDLLRWIEQTAEAVRDVRGMAELTESREEYALFRSRFFQLRDEDMARMVEEYQRRFDPSYVAPDVGDFPVPGPLPDVPKGLAGEAMESWSWWMEGINDIIEGLMDSIVDWVGKQGVVRPELAMSSTRGIMRIGFSAVAGLIGMVLAAETIGFWKHIGLGQIAAVIWDATQFRLITGAFTGAIALFALRIPLGYYFRDLFRPNLLSEAHFMELFSRKSFEQPEILMPADQVTAFKSAMGTGGSEFISRMLGFYGYRGDMEPFFRELSNSRLGYFALAAVARFGMFDEPWFRESLSRAGYSERVKDRLVFVYRQMANQAGRGRFVTSAQRGFREGLMTSEEMVETMVGFGFSREMADGYADGMALQMDISTKEEVASLVLRAYRSDVVDEAEARGLLTRLGMLGAHAGIAVLREKLGLLPRARLALDTAGAAAVEPVQIIAEGEAW